jgi:hypothetical protein
MISPPIWKVNKQFPIGINQSVINNFGEKKKPIFFFQPKTGSYISPYKNLS